MLSTRLLLTLLLPLYTLSSFSPPATVWLIIPDLVQIKGGVSNGTMLPFGFYDKDPDKYVGLSRVVVTSVTYPNGTTSVVNTHGALEDCTLSPGTRGIGHAIANQDGRYTGHWNITYAMSTFTNESESGICHSDRLSFENFTLERTIEVRLNGTTATGSPTARFVEAAQALGSQPTGSVGLNGGSRSYGNIGVAAATVPLVVGLVAAFV